MGWPGNICVPVEQKWHRRVNSACFSRAQDRKIWVSLALPSGSPHTFTFYQLISLFSISSTVFWLSSGLKTAQQCCTQFGSLPSTLGLIMLPKYKSVNVFHLLKILPWVSISNRHESLIPGENSKSLAFRCHLPFLSCLLPYPWWTCHVHPTSLPLHKPFLSLGTFLTSQPSNPHIIPHQT